MQAKPHVLILARPFPPSSEIGARRARRFARALSRAGMRVTVITTHERFCRAPDPGLLGEEDRSYRIVRTSTLAPTARIVAGGAGSASGEAAMGGGAPAAPGLRGRVLRAGRRAVLELMRPDEDLGWVPFATRAGRALVSRDPADVVLTTMPPFSALIAAERVARHCSARLVADYRDPWAADREIWSSRFGLQRRFEDWLEERLVRRVSLALFTSPSACEFYRRRFPGLREARVLLNGIDVRVSRRQPLLPPPLTWAHAGFLYWGRRTLAPVMRVMARLADEVPMRLVLIGDEPREELALARSLGLGSRVEWAGRLPFRETLECLGRHHRLVAVISRSHPYSIPAKLFDYMATRRPMLLLADEEHAAARLLADAPEHRVIAPEQEDRIEALIREDHERLAGSGLPDLDGAWSRPFESERQARKLVRWVEELVEGAGS